MSKKLIIKKRIDNKYISLKFPSRSNKLWITNQEYETLVLLLATKNTWDYASAELVEIEDES